eukprot:scaffold377_cov269-Pinguiococcus_pyrenoidosus.AAC.10
MPQNVNMHSLQQRVTANFLYFRGNYTVVVRKCALAKPFLLRTRCKTVGRHDWALCALLPGDDFRPRVRILGHGRVASHEVAGVHCAGAQRRLPVADDPPRRLDLAPGHCDGSAWDGADRVFNRFDPQYGAHGLQVAQPASQVMMQCEHALQRDDRTVSELKQSPRWSPRLYAHAEERKFQEADLEGGSAPVRTHAVPAAASLEAI